jgi:flagellar basal-body rod protein FlgG
MIRSLWVARTGMESQQTQMDTITNNLANVSTNSFKKSRAVFQDLIYQNVRQPGGLSSQQTILPSGMQMGTGSRAVAAERIFTQGNLQQTSNDYDLAIQGNGFFQVLMPDGTLSYTRDGSFQKDNQGQLTTAGGYVIQPAITIPIDALSLTVSRDGIVSVTQPGTTTPNQLGQLQLVSFLNPAGLQANGENLYTETNASGTPVANIPGTNGLGAILQGYVETSNVNVVEEMVNMITAQRAYELNSKAVTTSDQMLQKLTEL